jgi:sulfofructose kinase
MGLVKSACEKFDVIGVGCSAVDFLCLVPHYPSYNTKTRMARYEKQPGGQIATPLVALSRWGLKTAYVGKLGRDELSRFSLSELQKEGVDTSHVVLSADASAQVAFILIDTRTGERTIIWHRDPSSELRASEVDIDFVSRCSVLLIDGYEEAALPAARAARAAGAAVVLDADHADEKTQALIGTTDAVIASSDFFSASGDAKSPLEERLRGISALGPRVVAVTLGKEGSLALVEGRIIRTPGYAVHAVDTTGAGDIFHAAYIFGRLRGWAEEKRFDFANVMAALKCRRLGGRPGIAPVEEGLRMMEMRGK